MTYDYKKIWTISFPILVGTIIQQLIGLTDTAFLGRVGEIELGASAIAGVFYIMFFMLGHGFSIGAQIIMARRNGEGNFSEIAPILYQGLSFLFLGAAVVIAASLTIAPIVLKNIIQSPQIYAASIEYLDIRIYGLIFSFAIVMYRAFYVGITNTKILSLNAILMLFTNIILNYILIFGKFGFPAMGIQGAAIASVISEAVSLLFIIFYTRLKIDIEKYGFHKFIFFKLQTLKEILDISIWTMLQSFISLGTWFFFFVAIEHLSEDALAISNVLRSISSLPFMIMVALGAAANSITSNLIGAGHSQEILPTAKRIIKMGYVIGISVELIMAFLPILTMQIYTDNAELIQRAIPAYYVMLTVYLTLVPGMVLFSVVSGSGETKKALYMELFAMIFYTFNIWYVILYLKAPIEVCWTSEYSYNIVLFIVAYAYLKKNNWCCKKL